MSIFKKLKSAAVLLQNLDMDKIGKLAEKVDLNKMVGLVSTMKEEDLQKLMKYMEGGKKKHEFPEVDGDFYDLHALLTPEERAIQLQLREYMNKEIKPIVNSYWLKDEFPHQIIPSISIARNPSSREDLPGHPYPL